MIDALESALMKTACRATAWIGVKHFDFGGDSGNNKHDSFRIMI